VRGAGRGHQRPAPCLDALEHLCITYQPGGAHAPPFARACGFADGPDAPLDSYLHSQRVSGRSSDDRTLLVMVRAQ
jgi:hypothetical protein